MTEDLHTLTTISSYVGAMVPVFAFVTAGTSSNIGDDDVEIHQMC